MQLWTVSEVATFLKVSPRSVRRYIAEGRLNAYRFGQGYRVSEGDLATFIEAAGGEHQKTRSDVLSESSASPAVARPARGDGHTVKPSKSHKSKRRKRR